MSKKRGLSLEEKREKMLQIFYESQDFFLLKELEKMGPKRGVISQSVKDVIQSLVDDDLVTKDKIGISIYFWSLPSCAGNQLRSIRQKLESDIEGSNKKLSELIDQCDTLKKGREESEERAEALTRLKDIEKNHKELKNEMIQFADNDPATLEAMRNAIEVAHQSANRWTDNIFTLKQWCSNNFPQAKEQLEHLYTEAGITEDFDYIELSSFPLNASHASDTTKHIVEGEADKVKHVCVRKRKASQESDSSLTTTETSIQTILPIVETSTLDSPTTMVMATTETNIQTILPIVETATPNSAVLKAKSSSTNSPPSGTTSTMISDVETEINSSDLRQNYTTPSHIQSGAEGGGTLNDWTPVSGKRQRSRRRGGRSTRPGGECGHSPT